MKGFLTAHEAAEKWNLQVRYVQRLCATGRIEGVEKFGSIWAIPEDAEKPSDRRVTSGAYRNWRKKNKES